MVGTAVSFLILLSLILYEKKNTAKEHVFWIFHLHNQSSITDILNQEYSIIILLILIKSQRIHSDFANSQEAYTNFKNYPS